VQRPFFRALVLVCAATAVTAAAGLRFPLSGLSGPWVGFDRDGLGYELAVTTAHEAPLLSSWLVSDRFGWPGGTNLGYFFAGDYLHLGVLKTAAAIVGVGPAMNIYLFLGFPLAVLTASLFARRGGLGTWPSLLVGMAFALLPYHFIRATEHFFLGMIWTIPLGLLPAIMAVNDLSGRPLGPLGGWGRSRGDLLVVVVTSVVAGLSGVYYAFFTLLVWVPTAVLLVFRRPRSWGWALSPVVVLATTTGALAPSVLLMRDSPALVGLSERQPVESLIYSGTLPDLFGRFMTWEAAGSSIVVVTALGVAVAAVGARLARRLRKGAKLAPSALTAWLVATSGWLLLWWIRGGLGYLFAVVVTPQFRSLGRLLPFIALLALTLGAQIAVRWLDTSPNLHHRSVSRFAVAVGTVLLTILSVLQPLATPLTELVAQRDQVADLVAEAQRRVGGSCPLAVAPVVPLPESFYPGMMSPRSAIGVALEAHPGTPVSAGALRGTQQGAWAMPYAYSDALTSAHLFAALGYCVLVVDLDGFTRPEYVSRVMAQRLGDPLVRRGDLVAYSLRDIARDVPSGARDDLLRPAAMVRAPGSPAGPFPSGNVFWGSPNARPADERISVRVWNMSTENAQVLVRERTSPRGDLDPYLDWASQPPGRSNSLPVVLDVPAGSYADYSVILPTPRRLDGAARPVVGARQIELSACRLGAWIATEQGFARCEAPENELHLPQVGT